MRNRIKWTPDLDTRLRDLRWSGLTWDEISSVMNLGRNTVLERGRKIGARRAPPVMVVVESRDRPPMQAGHPVAWGALWAGMETPLIAFERRGPPPPLPECRWPTGDGADTRFLCSNKRLADCSYCAEHWDMAHRRSGLSASAMDAVAGRNLKGMGIACHGMTLMRGASLAA